jgi:hypothetical protein
VNRFNQMTKAVNVQDEASTAMEAACHDKVS